MSQEPSQSTGNEDPSSGTKPTGPGWNCPNCGVRVPGNFDVCWKCLGTQSGEQAEDAGQCPPVPPRPESNAGPVPSPTGRGSPEGTPWFRARATLVLGAWLVALLAVGYPFLAAPAKLLVAPTLIVLFPFGLARIFGLDPMGNNLSVGVVYFAACVIYVLLTIALFFVPQGRAFRTLYVVLLVLLALNVGGCHMK